jgi:deoxyribodipyrimidine photolyase
MPNNTFSKLYTFQNSKIRLEEFMQNKLSQYKYKRNYDFGELDKNFVSGLSPAISRRIITEFEVIKEIRKHFNFREVEKYIDEICWRTYWKGFLEHYPQIWYDYLDDIDDFKSFNLSEYQNALNGRTKINCFNIWVNELKINGYLHNHTRMWFASIWIFQLELPWQLGAHFFLQNLLDADAAVNTLSWRWVAGLHTKGKSYRASPNNINKFTNSRFSITDQFKNTINSILDERSYEKKKINFSKLEQSKNITGNHGVIFHEKDLSRYDLKKEDFILIQKSHFNPYDQSKAVENFTNKSLSSFGKNLENLHNFNITYFDWDQLETINVWKNKYNIKSVSISYPCVGKLVKPIKDAQKCFNVNFRYYTHEWDRLFWPHSSKGFFKLKKYIKKNIKVLLEPN